MNHPSLQCSASSIWFQNQISELNQYINHFCHWNGRLQSNFLGKILALYEVLYPAGLQSTVQSHLQLGFGLKNDSLVELVVQHVQELNLSRVLLGFSSNELNELKVVVVNDQADLVEESIFILKHSQGTS